MIKAIIKFLRFVETKLIPCIAICLFVFSVTWMLIEALSRQVFHHSFAISEELVVFSLLWAVFLILPQAGRSGFHINVDLVLSRVSKKNQRILRIITGLLSMAYCVVMVLSAHRFISHLYQMRIISESPLQWPMWLVCSSVFLGFALMTIYYFEITIAAILNRNLSPYASGKASP